MKIKTLDVLAKEWFDKTYGDSYFSAVIIINYGTKSEKKIEIPFQYGYGDHFLTVASKVLKEKGYLKDMDERLSLWSYCKEKNIIFRNSKIGNCKKRELLDK